MDPPLAPLLVPEVLDDVGDVRVIRRDAGALESLVEHPTRRADERVPLEILLVSGLLPDEHHGGVARTLAHHPLRGPLPQVAGATFLNRAAHLRSAGSLWNGRCGSIVHPDRVPGR